MPQEGNRCAWALVFSIVGMALGHGEAVAQSQGPTGSDAKPAGVRRMVTQGLAKTVDENLFKCGVPLGNYRASPVGTITADDGTVLTVPAQTAYRTGPKLTDLFNGCNKIAPAKASDVNPESVPIVEIDPDGEVITGYIVGDNYFELYVNGKLVGIDPVPFTPFNSVIVRFRAKKPYTYALKAVDWEERLGLGMETNRGNEWHAGDGGLLARFSDGTVTDVPGRPSHFISLRWRSPATSSRRAMFTKRPHSDASIRRRKCRPAASDVLPCITPSRKTGRRRISTTRAGPKRSSSPTRTSASSTSLPTPVIRRRSRERGGSGPTIWCSTTLCSRARRFADRVALFQAARENSHVVTSGIARFCGGRWRDAGVAKGGGAAMRSARLSMLRCICGRPSLKTGNGFPA